MKDYYLKRKEEAEMWLNAANAAHKRMLCLGNFSESNIVVAKRNCLIKKIQYVSVANHASN